MEYLWLIVLAAVVVGVGLWQLAVWLVETRAKNRQYKAACARALREGKPLLVAGGPWGITRTRRRLNIPAHGNGDICLDIDPRALGDHPRGVVANVTHIPFADKSFGAVFASHLLEHLPTVEAARQALDELNRVAEAVYIVYPSRQSFAGWLIPDHHLWVWQKDDTTYLRKRGKSTGGRAAEHYG
jgi:hypothetical protein